MKKHAAIALSYPLALLVIVSCKTAAWIDTHLFGEPYNPQRRDDDVFLNHRGVRG